MGAEFCVRFPLISESLRKEAEMQNIRTQKSFPTFNSVSLTTPGGKPSVLSVEDNDYNQDLMEMFLKDHYQVTKAFDGQTAIRMATREKYNIVLIDINLGLGIDGVITMKEIKKIPGYEDVPFIAVTGYNNVDEKSRFLREGFDVFLGKPFTRDDLFRAISHEVESIR